MFRGRLQKDEGIQFSGSTKQVSQKVNQSVYKLNEGILFSGTGIPSSRPLHIYRKTGPTHAITSSNMYNGCTISATDWKMLGKNQYKYLNPTAVCGTCKPYYANATTVTCPQCPTSNTGCVVPSVDCKARYYHDNSRYIKKTCLVNERTVSAYNVVKINNPTFPATWGAVTASSLALRKKYDALLKNNSSLLKEYQRRLNLTETPLSEVYRLTFKKPPHVLCTDTCYTK